MKEYHNEYEDNKAFNNVFNNPMKFFISFEPSHFKSSELINISLFKNLFVNEVFCYGNERFNNISCRDYNDRFVIENSIWFGISNLWVNGFLRDNFNIHKIHENRCIN